MKIIDELREIEQEKKRTLEEFALKTKQLGMKQKNPLVGEIGPAGIDGSDRRLGRWDGDRARQKCSSQ